MQEAEVKATDEQKLTLQLLKDSAWIEDALYRKGEGLGGKAGSRVCYVVKDRNDPGMRLKMATMRWLEKHGHIKEVGEPKACGLHTLRKWVVV